MRPSLIFSWIFRHFIFPVFLSNFYLDFSCIVPRINTLFVFFPTSKTSPMRKVLDSIPGLGTLGVPSLSKSDEEKLSGLSILVHIQCGFTIKYCKPPKKSFLKKKKKSRPESPLWLIWQVKDFFQFYSFRTSLFNEIKNVKPSNKMFSFFIFLFMTILWIWNKYFRSGSSSASDPNPRGSERFEGSSSSFSKMKKL